MKRLTKLFLLSFVLPTTALAQITGRVVDENARPVAYANAVVLTLPDSSAVGGVTTKENGTFTLPTPTADALLRITLVGYEPLYRRISTTDHALGNLTLEAEGQRMGEATVTAVRPVAKLVGGAIVTGIEGTTLANEGTAGDVLAKVPGILRKTDSDGDTYEVLGKGTPVIYINGRQMRDLKELTRLRSDEIKSVEVITNPGAEYDATVSAVVRIRTVKRRGEGFGVEAEANYRQGRYAKTNERVNLNYRHDGLELFLGFENYNSKSYWQSDITQEIKADTLWQVKNATRSNFEEDGYTVTTGFNYDISEKHSVGLRYELTNNYHRRNWGNLSSGVLANGVYNDSLQSQREGNDDYDLTHSVNAYYNGQIGKGELHVDADFYADGQSSTESTIEESVEHDDRTVSSVNNVRNRLIATKASYAFPWLGGKFTVGGQYTFTNRHDDYLIPTNSWGVAASRSQLKQQNAAGFVSYSRPVKIGMLTAGLRYEHVSFDYYEDHVHMTDQSRTYDNLFPSISLATKLGHMQFMASYSAKTVRPGYYQLSANVTYANRYLLQGGNPLLKNGTDHNVSLVGVWKFLQGTLSFTQHQGAILNWYEQAKDETTGKVLNNVSKLTMINKDYPEFTAVLTAAPQIGIWQPRATAVLMGSYVKLNTVDGAERFNNPMFIGVLNNAFTLPADFVLNVDYTFRSKGNYQNCSLNSNSHMLNVSLQKSFLRDKSLVLILSGRDLLHDMVPDVGVNGAVASLFQHGWGDTRTFGITLRYKFNTTQSKYKGQSAAQDELNRLSGGSSNGTGIGQ